MSKHDEFIVSQKVNFARELAHVKKLQREGLYPLSLSFPVGLQFELTAKCNMRCKHCYNMSAPERVSDMKLENWLAVVNDIVTHGGIFQCILSGGEPFLLGEDIFKIMDPLDNDGTGFVIITNGFLVTPELVKSLKKYKYYWVQVSIDSLFPKEHDLFRGKEGAWERAVEAAMLFADNGFPLRIAHSVTPESVPYMEEFADFCFQLGASSLVCGEVFLSGRTALNRDLLMTPEGYEQLHLNLEKTRKKYQGKMAIYASTPEHLDIRYKRQSLNSSVIIRPNGDVRLDCTMPFTIGNVLENKLSTIWQEKGNTCWQMPAIKEYIASPNGHINHFDKDFQL